VHPIAQLLLTLAGFAAIVFAVQFIDRDSVKHVDWPAWIQAVGSILAIGAGAFFVWWQHYLERKQERAERDLEAGTLAVALYPEIHEVRAKLVAIRRVANDFAKRPMAENFNAVVPLLTLDIPPILEASLDRLHLLGSEAGASVQQLVAFAMQHNRMVERVEGMIRRGEREPTLAPPPSLAPFEGHISACERLASEALSRVAKLHDKIVPNVEKLANQSN
jgi:hypothetical protein